MLTALGVILGVSGIALTLMVRFNVLDAPPRLAGVGQISRITLLLSGLALLAIGYHILNEAHQLKMLAAPMPIAIGAAIGVVALSLIADAMQGDAVIDHHDSEDPS